MNDTKTTNRKSETMKTTKPWEMTLADYLVSMMVNPRSRRKTAQHFRKMLTNDHRESTIQAHLMMKTTAKFAFASCWPPGGVTVVLYDADYRRIEKRTMSIEQAKALDVEWVSLIQIKRRQQNERD